VMEGEEPFQFGEDAPDLGALARFAHPPSHSIEFPLRLGDADTHGLRQFRPAHVECGKTLLNLFDGERAGEEAARPATNQFLDLVAGHRGFDARS
jgi:hypothetical protein